MPDTQLYAYVDEAGDFELFRFPVGEAPSRFRRKGRSWIRGYKPACTHRNSVSAWSKEHVSWAAGVPFYEKSKYEKFCTEVGVPTEYRIEGHSARPVYRSPKHRRDHLRVVGLCDMDAGYSDAAPRSW